MAAMMAVPRRAAICLLVRQALRLFGRQGARHRKWRALGSGPRGPLSVTITPSVSNQSRRRFKAGRGVAGFILLYASDWNRGYKCATPPTGGVTFGDLWRCALMSIDLGGVTAVSIRTLAYLSGRWSRFCDLCVYVCVLYVFVYVCVYVCMHVSLYICVIV